MQLFIYLNRKVNKDMPNYDDLIKIKEMLDQGIITQDEFNSLKRKILSGFPPEAINIILPENSPLLIEFCP